MSESLLLRKLLNNNMNDRRVRFKGKRYRMRFGQNFQGDERPEGSMSSPSMPEHLQDRPKRERPPPHLKGKAIGLWYRDRNRLKQRKENEDRKKTPLIPLELGQDKLLQIQQILGSFNFSDDFKHAGSSTSAGCSSDKYVNIKDSDFKHRFIKSVSGSLEEKIKEGAHSSSLRKLPTLDERYKNELLEKYENNRQFNDLMEFRKKLPAFEKRQEIVEALEKSNVILISGETGCGKTTQVAQFLLEDEILAGKGSTCHIICTQPRRISAISVAERVAVERGEKLGHSAGFQIRLEKVAPRNTGSILFCTTGVLLQYMHNDPLLTLASHVIIDEVHERDTLSDFVITLIKDILPVRPDLKVILMSATLNADKFSKYLNDCPTVLIPGFTFPVTEYYLEDVLQMTGFRICSGKKEPRDKRAEREGIIIPYLRKLESDKKYERHVIESLYKWESEEINMDLIIELLKKICVESPDREAILVFLPGWDKISKLNKMLTEDGHLSSSRYIIIPLHSLMPTVAQRSVFDRPPQGKRKIVIATNIAETSITIDDVVHVIDCGKIKLKNFDVDTNLNTLREEWVSIANARDRKSVV